MIAAFVVLVGLGVYWWVDRSRRSGEQGNDDTESRERAEGETPAIRVKTVHPRRGGFSLTTTQPGVVHYFEQADLYAKASGYLRAQVVDIGDTVKRGQVLAEVYDPERQQRVEQSAAQVAEARADVKQAEAVIRVAQAEVTAATALVGERKADVARYVALRSYRQKQYIRYVELAVSRAVDERAADEKQEDFESARAGEEVATAAVRTAEGQLAKAVAGLEKARADFDVALARQRVAEAGEAYARILAEYVDLVSPYDGIVTQRTYHRGAFIRSASEGESSPVLSVARTDLMRVIVYVPDRFVPHVDRGDEAVIRFDSLPGEQFKGELSRYSNLEFSANRTMRVEIDLPNPTGRFREGMYGPVTILLEPPSPDVLIIPSQALVEKSISGDGQVFVVQDGMARKRSVRVGKDDGMKVEILTGLKPDDTIVLSYSGSLDDGDPVEARPVAVVEGKHEENGGEKPKERDKPPGRK
jgi:HlyD family secretion protein